MNRPDQLFPPDGPSDPDKSLEPSATDYPKAGSLPTPVQRVRSDDLFHLLVSSIRDYAIFMIDPSGYVLTWNLGAERFKGYREDEIIGKHFSVFYTPEDRAGGKPARNLATAIREGRSEDESWRVRKDGTRFWADVVLTPLRDKSGNLVGFAKVTRDLTERKRGEEERLELVRERAARNAAERAVYLRDEFLSVAAHELKTPVTSLRLRAQVILREFKAKAVIPRSSLEMGLTSIVTQSQKLGDLVDKLLDVSRISNGRLAVDLVETDVVPLVDGVIEAARSSSPSRSIVLDAPPRLGAKVDPLRFEQVVTNLIDNALKYSADTPIEVSVTPDGSTAFTVVVRDHGPGIPEAFRDNIFDRFFQASSVSPQSGMGLGLYISKEIVRLHGGTIRAEFPADGGSRFVVCLSIDPGVSSAT